MSELATLARPYAKAYFRLALEEGQMELRSRELALLAVIIRDSSFIQYLSRPEWTAVQQADLVCRIPEEPLSSTATGLVNELAHYKRLALLPQVFVLYELYRSEAQSTMDVQVTTAFPLSDTEEAEIIRSLSVRMARTVKAHVEIDPSLMGGLVVRAGDLVIDASVRGKIARLRDTLNSQA